MTNEKNTRSKQPPDPKIGHKSTELKHKNGPKSGPAVEAERTKKTNLGSILGIISLIQGVGPYTAIHERRTAQLAHAIAEEMGLSEDTVQAVEVAALLHDSARATVPQDILAFPGQIGQDGKNLVKTQPQVAYDMLKELDIPSNVAEIVLQHHERRDGSGYPGELSGEAILMEARILALADVVEAMCSNRSYRSALGVERALDEISSHKNTLYDPGVVDACVKVFNEKGFTFV